MNVGMPLQVSNYNFIINRDGRFVAYNARLGNFAEITEEAAKVLDGEEPVSALQETRSLIDMGFLHNGDEKDQISDRFNATRDEKYLYFTFTPTLACNFACDYCFQDGFRNKKRWGDKERQGVLKFVRHLLEQDKRDIMVTWFGGEPLLEAETILEMSKSIREIADEFGVRIAKSNIVTNGLLMTEDLANDLQSAGVTEAQVSIDALNFVKPIHRGVKLKNGEPSPIVANALVASKYLDVNFRINVDRKVANNLDEIIAFLKMHGLGEKFGFARVDNYDEDTEGDSSDQSGCGKWKQTNSTIPREEYAGIEKQGWQSGSNYLRVIKSKLRPKTSACAATTGNMFVVDAEGHISRCWASAGKSEEAEGHIDEFTDLGIGSGPSESRWLGYTPLAYKECKNCKVLPLCMGGCSYPRLFREAKSPPCEAIKRQISGFVDEVGQHIQLPV